MTGPGVMKGIFSPNDGLRMTTSMPRLAHAQGCATCLTEQAAFQLTFPPTLSSIGTFGRSQFTIPLFLFSLTTLAAWFLPIPLHTFALLQMLSGASFVQLGSNSPIRHISLLLFHEDFLTQNFCSWRFLFCLSFLRRTAALSPPFLTKATRPCAALHLPPPPRSPYV
jgi:hypothetical protein